MTKAETQGVTFPLPAQYRQQDYDLANVTPDQVRSILRNVRNGRLEDQDRLFRLMLDTWPRLRKNLGEVAGAVSRLPLEIIAPIPEGQEQATPKASAIADVVRRAFNSYAPKAGAWELSGPDAMKAGIAAYLKGIVALEIVWQVANGIASPRCYSPVPAKYLSYPQQGNEVDRLMVAPQGVPTSTLEDFPPDRFLIFVWSNFDAHPIHSALLRPLAKEWLAYIYGKGWAMQYAQLFGIPWRTIKTDGSEEANAEADAFLANIGSSGWARHTTSTEFQIHDGVKGDASQLPQMVIAHEADRQCDILLLGQTLTTDVGDSGSRALGDVHMAVRADVLQAVASWVAGVITDQLIPAIVRFNFGSVPTEEMPYCEIQVPEARDEKAIAERVKLLKEIGLDIPKKWAHETLNVPIPEPGDELLESKPEEVGEEPSDDEAFESLDDLSDEELAEDEEMEAHFEWVQAKSMPKAGKGKSKATGGKYFRKSSSYDPNQKRYPKGHPKAGQWADDGVSGKGERAKRGKMREATEDDIKRLKIPRGFTGVRVTDDKGSDVVAIAKNAKGRDVFFYTDAYAQKQQAVKFARIGALHREMPGYQSRINKDFASGENRDKAAVVRLVTLTGFRNGGEKGGGKVETFGASSLRMSHVRVRGDTIYTDFPGKKGVRQRHAIRDPELADYVRTRQRESTSGDDRLFRGMNSQKTLNYWSEVNGGKFKVHDLRTWHATTLAETTIQRIGQRGEWPTNPRQFKAFQTRVARVVSRRLGNDPAMALKAYIAPQVWKTTEL